MIYKIFLRPDLIRKNILWCKTDEEQGNADIRSFLIGRLHFKSVIKMRDKEKTLTRQP